MGRPKKEAPNRADGLYEVKITVGKTFDGKLIRKSFYSNISKADARKQAEDYKIKQEVESITGIRQIEENIQFDVWATKWLESYVKGTVKDNTFNLKYKNAVNNHLIPHFKKADIGTIKQIDIQTFLNEKGKEKSLETVKNIYNCLNKIFECAIDNELISKNPCKKVKLTSKIKPIKKSVYTSDEVALISDFAKKHRFGLEIIFLIRLGLRRGELLGITWDDIDFENKILYINQAVADVQNPDTRKMEVVVADTKTLYSNRPIPLPDDIIEHLKEKPREITLFKGSKKQKIIKPVFVFCNAQGNVCSPRTWSRRHYDVFMNEMTAFYANKDKPIEIQKLNPHELRHTVATLLVNGDKNLFAIASVLGWGDLKMLRQRYAHADIESTRNALNL